MKKIAVTVSFILFSLTLLAQERPAWLNDNQRSQKYPSNVYFTGFAYGEILPNKSLQEITQQIKTEAQTDLSKKIRLQVSSKTQTKTEAVSNNGKYSENESFKNQAVTVSNAEIVGMKSETYYDEKAKLIYAFAYANKYELIGYYKSNLSMNINQIESYMNTAKDLETQKEKAKARQQLETAKPLFLKVRYAQDILTAIDPDISSDDLQQSKLESLYNQLTQMQARLEQGVYIMVQSKEDLFGEKVEIAVDKIKGELSRNGCSFTGVDEHTDLVLTITITTRMVGNTGSMITCAADAQIQLFDMYKQKAIYEDRISETGSSITQEKAGRFALNKLAPAIVEKLLPWVKK